MPHVHRILLLMFALDIGTVTHARELPTAPSGFVWVAFEEAKSAFLKPDGWFVKREVRDGTAALFISKEDIEAVGQFETGLTLNYIDDVRKKVGQSPSKYAAGMLGVMASQLTVLKSLEEEDIAPGIAGYTLRCKSGSGPPKIMHYFILADDSADTLRLIIFEAPFAKWDEAWKVGELMTKPNMWK